LQMEKLNPICNYISEQLEEKVLLRRKDFRGDFYGPFFDLNREGVLKTSTDLYRPDFPDHYIHRYRYSYLAQICLEESMVDPDIDEAGEMIWIKKPNPKVEAQVAELKEFPIRDETDAEAKIKRILIEVLNSADVKKFV